MVLTDGQRQDLEDRVTDVENVLAGVNQGDLQALGLRTTSIETAANIQQPPRSICSSTGVTWESECLWGRLLAAHTQVPA